MQDKYCLNILEVIKGENGRLISYGIILRKLYGDKVISHYEKQQIKNALDNLEKNQLIKKINDKYTLGYQTGNIISDKVFEGIISTNSKKDGYISSLNPENSQEWFVFNKNLNGALNGDTVFFYETDKPVNKRGIKEAVIKEVSSRNKIFFTATFCKNNESYSLIYDDPKITLETVLESTQGLVNGHKIIVQIKVIEDEKIFGNVHSIIGHKEDVGVDVLSIVYDNGVATDFESKALKQAGEIKFEITDEQKKVRHDLTNLNIITIDPATSKDLDDAIYVEKISDNKYFLLVSIADVSHYVPYETALDDDAKMRATSVYLVDRVIPMLPHNLSNNICSLNPCEKRFAISTSMYIDSKGNLSEIKVFPSIIESKQRFSYDEVNDYFDDNSKNTAKSKQIADMLLNSKELYSILKNAKEKAGYIDFEIKEPEIICDELGKPIDIITKNRGDAQMMIESFMIAANEAVTIFAENHKLPFVYRTHDKPELKKLKMFAIEAKKLDFNINEADFDDIKPTTYVKWLQNNKNNKSRDMINRLMLRSMAKAKYQTNNQGHFGLASNNYTHFTSPIRRYPDLMVHRIFWMFMFTPEKYSNEIRQKFVNELDELCIISSQAEIKAVRTERDVNEMKFAEYMSDKVGQEFDGVISTVRSFGIFIELPNCIEGIIRTADLVDDFYVYDENSFKLIGQRTKKAYTLGMPVKVRCINASKHLRQIDFMIAGQTRDQKKPQYHKNNDRGYKRGKRH